jgi:hypothetical protein
VATYFDATKLKSGAAGNFELGHSIAGASGSLDFNLARQHSEPSC